MFSEKTTWKSNCSSFKILYGSRNCMDLNGGTATTRDALTEIWGDGGGVVSMTIQ